MRPLVIVGAGGFGRETVDVVRAISQEQGGSAWELVGVVDDDPSDVNLERLSMMRVPYLGTVNAQMNLPPSGHYVIGIGAPRIRQRLASRFDAAGWVAATLVHPAATIGSETVVSPGTIICAGARLTTNIRVGRHVHVNPNVTVGHDTDLGDYVSLNPASSISGDCLIDSGVLVGVGAVVSNRIRVGRSAIVGAGACVVKDVKPGSTVTGVPARERQRE